MPRLAGFKVTEVRDLERQLVYAPPEARQRHMEKAESLVAEIDPGCLYPIEFVVYRITGYRPELRDTPVHLVGEALVQDLVTLIQRLSESLRIELDRLERPAIRFDALPERLGVSARTLRRYRRQGLVCHYVIFPDGLHRLACFEDALDRFLAGHRGQVNRAATFTRVPATIRDRIVSDARTLRADEGLSLNAAARRLAGRYERAHETIRAILQGHDRTGDPPIFTEPGPLQAHDARIIHRAVRLGIPVGALAQRFGKTRGTIHRALNRRRAEMLRSLTLRYVELPIMARPEAEPVVLSGPTVARGLDDLLPHDDAPQLLAAAHGARVPDQDTERTLLGGYGLLKRRAGRAIEALGDTPSATALDAIETDLRWATLLKRRLVCLGLPETFVAVEQTLGRPLIECPAETITAMVTLSVEVVSGVIETIDPMRDQRLAHAAGFATNRRLASIAPPAALGRAAVRHEPGSVRLPNLFGRLSAWQPWLDLSPAQVRRVSLLPERERTLLERHHGLAGERPLNTLELADHVSATPSAVATTIRRAQASLRAY